MEKGFSRGIPRLVLRAWLSGSHMVWGSGGEGPYQRSSRLFPGWPTVALDEPDLLLGSRQREVALDSWERPVVSQLLAVKRNKPQTLQSRTSVISVSGWVPYYASTGSWPVRGHVYGKGAFRRTEMPNAREVGLEEMSCYGVMFALANLREAVRGIFIAAGVPFPQYPRRLFTMFFSSSPFSNLAYWFRKKSIA